jgi:hypothetical protein
VQVVFYFTLTFMKTKPKNQLTIHLNFLTISFSLCKSFLLERTIENWKYTKTQYGAEAWSLNLDVNIHIFSSSILNLKFKKNKMFECFHYESYHLLGCLEPHCFIYVLLHFIGGAPKVPLVRSLNLHYTKIIY